MGNEDERSAFGIGRGAAAGLAVGAVAGLAFAAVDSVLCALAGQGDPQRHALSALLARSVAGLLPLAMVAGGGCGAFFGAVGRMRPGLQQWLVRALPWLWLAGLFGYGSMWSAAVRGVMGYKGTAQLVVAVLAAGWVGYALLRALALRAGRRGVLAVVAASAVLWGAALALTLVRPPVAELPVVAAGEQARPNVLLIVLDTVRADHMSCYGYHRRTTPRIDAFAEDARLYRNVLSPGGWTGPSHASIFTGLPVAGHGCTWLHRTLQPEFTTLAEHLQAAGYQTAGFSSNRILTEERRFSQGFERYWRYTGGGRGPRWKPLADRLPAWIGGAPQEALAVQMHRKLAGWLREDYEPAKPFFVFLNYMEAHEPYESPAPERIWASERAYERWSSVKQNDYLSAHKFGSGSLTPAEITELEALYDEEIAYVDGKVGEVLDWLSESGLLDGTVVAITSDHGEHFGEHHLMVHRCSLYEPIVRVPLIVRYPGAFARGVEEALVQTHDVFPTALELAGVPWERTDSHDCVSLLAIDADEPRLGIAEYGRRSVNVFDATRGTPQEIERLRRGIRAVHLGDRKLIRWDDGERALYDLVTDPLEVRDLAEADPDGADRLADALDAWLGSFERYTPPADGAADGAPASPAELEALRGLGYIR